MRRFYTVQVPTHVAPIIRFIFEEMNRQQIGMGDMAERAGFHRNTLGRWRERHKPDLADLEAALNVLGYTTWMRRINE